MDAINVSQFTRSNTEHISSNYWCGGIFGSLASAWFGFVRIWMGMDWMMASLRVWLQQTFTEQKICSFTINLSINALANHHHLQIQFFET